LEHSHLSELKELSHLDRGLEHIGVSRQRRQKPYQSGGRSRSRTGGRRIIDVRCGILDFYLFDLEMAHFG